MSPKVPWEPIAHVNCTLGQKTLVDVGGALVCCYLDQGPGLQRLENGNLTEVSFETIVQHLKRQDEFTKCSRENKANIVTGTDTSKEDDGEMMIIERYDTSSNDDFN
ncbi:hypothetical protein BdWA1_003399 [Babesia duncani]|uniref:Uncharacterized protein n=1 Tax=Babesia duncani TaxID=323732 RepID=A0AAD9UMN6_9APIC|nr:hypothetical protein BdWA1_003399 [Babesia duncani]